MAQAKTVTTPAASDAVRALAALIAASQTGGLMLTQAEGAEIVAGGFATVDPSQTDGDKALVSLTETGIDLLPDAKQAPLPVNQANAVKPVFSVRTDVPMPTKRRGKRGSVYPIETMNVGESFHIPVSAENPDPAMRIASSLSNARIKFAEATGETETVTVKVYAKDAAGKMIKDAEGKRIVASTTEETRPVTKNTRDWSVATVDATDPDGVGARVWRTL